MQDDIADLLERLSRQDRAALRALYDRAAPKLVGLLIRMLGNRAEAEDALQDVFVKLWQRAATFDPDKGSGMSWICAIARNHALDLLRARKSRAAQQTDPLDDDIQISDPGLTAESTLMLRARMQDVIRCFDELPPDRAKAVQAAYLKGHSYQELAEKHSVPLNTMRTWLRRALISLRECLGR